MIYTVTFNPSLDYVVVLQVMKLYVVLRVSMISRLISSR